MKKITFILFLTFFFSGITHLTATDFAHCLHTERLKARKEGSSLDVFITHQLSIAFGALNSTYDYQYPFSEINYRLNNQ